MSIAARGVREPTGEKHLDDSAGKALADARQFTQTCFTFRSGNLAHGQVELPQGLRRPAIGLHPVWIIILLIEQLSNFIETASNVVILHAE